MPTKPKKAAQKSGATSSSVAQPRASRPVVPRSYRFPASLKGMLDWSWARERLAKSYNYVIVTVRPDGRPHAMGMHGLWFEDAYYFGTSPHTRKAKNLARNPHCIVISEDMSELIIVEGIAETIGYDALPKGLSDLSKSKYGWPIDPRMGGQVYRVKPKVVFAFPLKQIASAVTKWTFD